MKTLFISEMLLGRDDGCKVCAWSHAERLYELSDSLTVVAIYRDLDEAEIDKDKFSKYDESYFIQAFKNKVENITNIMTLNGWCQNSKIINSILELIEKNNYDFVFIDDSVMGRLTRKIKKEFPNVKVVTYYQDVKAELSKQWMKEGGLRTVPFNLGIMHNEKINQKYTDANIVLNERENKLLMKHYGIEADGFLPVCVADVKCVEALNNAIQKDKEKIKILFVGTYYGPNINGIKWFADKVFSNLDSRFTLEIVGSQMDKLKGQIDKDERITIHGWVESLDEVYMNADIVIAPIFEGGGMKIKTAEAMRYGKCFVGTQESFEGYAEYICPPVLNSHMHLCASAQEFIEAINKIAESDICLKYNESVRDIYLQHFSEECVRGYLKTIIKDVGIE